MVTGWRMGASPICVGLDSVYRPETLRYIELQPIYNESLPVNAAFCLTRSWSAKLTVRESVFGQYFDGSIPHATVGVEAK